MTDDVARTSATIVTGTVRSEALGEDIRLRVYLPAGYHESEARHPVLYLLHGRGDRNAAWERAVPELDRLITDGTLPPVIAVMPDAPWSERAGWYVDSAHVHGRPVETAMIRDLVPAIDAAYRTVASREARLVCGYSMGGAGALRFALAHPDLFGGAIVLSPAVYTPLPPEDSNTRRFGAYGRGEIRFHEDAYRALNYPAALATYDGAAPLRIVVAAGDGEHRHTEAAHDVEAESVALHRALRDTAGITAHLRILGGGHDWGTWRAGFAEGLRLHAPDLRAAAADAGTVPTVSPRPARPALSGVRVVELATLFAGPLAGAFLSDFGADVIKVEHPVKPDPSRGHGPRKDGIGLWWKVLGRNKRTLTANLSAPDGGEVLKRLIADADVLIENFRPGTLERWGLGPEVLHAINPRLVIARVSGFGQVGPYARRPGFGTLAEAMSGFAAATGEPDGPPTLPPFGLADSVAALATAYAITLALTARTATGAGQVVDVAIIEPIMAVLGPQITWYDQVGYVQPRLGNRTGNNAPRNTYRCADGGWVAVSTSAQSIAERVMRLVGRPDTIEQDWFATGVGRAAHADELDAAVAAWVGQRSRAEVIAAFEQAEAAVAPVYTVADIVEDPQYAALGSIVTVDDADFGPLRMQNVPFRLTATPGTIRFTGRAHGEDTDTILAEAGYTETEIDALRSTGAI